MAPEWAIHTRTKYAVTRRLKRGIGEAGLPCEPLVDGMTVCVEEETVLEPDALVRCGPRLADDAIVVVDPVIVIVLHASRTVLHHRRAEGLCSETTIYSTGSMPLEPPGLRLDVTTLFPPSGDDIDN